MRKQILLRILLPVILLVSACSSHNNYNPSRIVSPEMFALIISSDQLVYTIQAGSFIKQEGAEKQFAYLLNNIGIHNTGHLRIEKIDKFYTVRLGKFYSYSSAQKPLQLLRDHFSDVLILEAYIRDRNIVREHNEISYMANNH